MSEEKTLVRVCRAKDVPLNEARRIDVNGRRVAIYHLPLGFFATADTCSHDEASLSEGELEDTTVECPKHGSTFDLETGKPLSLPATRPVAVYRVVVDGDDVLVEDPDA